MDKFVQKWKQQKDRNPNAVNHLSNQIRTKPKPNKISNYFQIQIQSNNNINNNNNNNNSDDDDIIILNSDDDDEDDDLIQSLRNPRNKYNFKNNQAKKKQKSLKTFLKDVNQINKKSSEKKIDAEHAKYRYLTIPALINETYLYSLNELCGFMNNGSCSRLSQLYSRNIININSDSINRRYYHMIINNNNLHKLPFIEPFYNENNTHINEMDYISSVKFDKYGSLLCASSTNGRISIYDFDKLLTKWNTKARISYNQYIKQKQIEQQELLLNGDDGAATAVSIDYGQSSIINTQEISINTDYRIENIEWSANQNDIAVCGHGGGKLNIYDLRRTSNKPKLKLKSSSNQPLITSKYSPKYSHIICGGDRHGSVWCWDFKNKSSRPCLKFHAKSQQTTIHSNSLFNNGSGYNTPNRARDNLSNYAVKHIHISNDGILLYVIRENGFIDIMDIRKPNHIYKNIDLWRCQLDDNNNKKNDNSILHSNAYKTSHRARIDDGIIIESMNTALLKLRNNSLVNVNLESNIIRKTYSCNSDQNNPVDITFLSRVMQRRMCSLERYGMREMIITGSFNSEMLAIDMSTELDAYYLEQEYRDKRCKYGLMTDILSSDTSSSSSFCSAKTNWIKEQQNKTELNNKSYGLMGSTALSNIMTSCSIHPKLLYTVCGTLNNSLEIVACSSNPINV